MILTKDQEIALNSIKLWWQQRNLKQLYFLNGYAGTGKTTLIRYVIDDLKLDLTRIAFIAFTGKAALVIQQKHLFPATTIHKKIYKSYYDEKTNKLISIRRSKKEMEDIDLFILDECSMVSKKLMKDLLSFNKPIICIGDTFQLPPVSSESYFYKGFNPDSTLEEITRQSLDNPIIKLSMDIRENKWPKRGLYGESILINFYDFIDINYLLQADQVICGYNNTRINVNRWFRNKLFGYIPDKPVIGDKIICLKNHQDTEIVNGQLFIIISQPVYLDNTFTADLKDIATEQVFKVTCSSLFLNKQLEINKQTSKIEDVIVDYGYCITCHKSQGSQWDSVYLFEEPIGIPERWLYTGITRAAEKLIIAKEANLW